MGCGVGWVDLGEDPRRVDSILGGRGLGRGDPEPLACCKEGPSVQPNELDRQEIVFLFLNFP